MTVGYIIIAHHKPQQLLRLVKAVRQQTPGPIVIHFDRKSLSIFRNLFSTFCAIPSVQLLSKRRVKWGQYSIVEATLDCMRTMLAEFPAVSHVMLLSGQDYPIKPIATFELKIASLGHMSAMDVHQLPWSEWINRGGLDRVEYTYLHVAHRAFRIFKRQLPENLTFYGGSQFWCLARNHCLHLLAEANKWMPLFEHSLIPDEMFFHTILMNSPFYDQVIKKEVTYRRFSGHAANPVQFDLRDLRELTLSEAFFARKFDLDSDPYIFGALDREIGIFFD